MEKIRPEIHTRSRFASNEYHRIIKSVVHGVDLVSGFKAKKLCQAHRIFKHYQAEFCKDLELINKN